MICNIASQKFEGAAHQLKFAHPFLIVLDLCTVAPSNVPSSRLNLWVSRGALFCTYVERPKIRKHGRGDGSRFEVRETREKEIISKTQITYNKLSDETIEDTIAQEKRGNAKWSKYTKTYHIANNRKEDKTREANI